MNLTKTRFAALLFALFSFFMVTSALAALSPVGTWTSIDDATHKPRAVIQITEKNGVLYGTILKIYPQPGDTGICSKCPGNFKNKPIKGLTIMWGLKATGDNSWGGGQILDPKLGRVYGCKLSLSADGKTLSVRGYIGISILGRTQTWVKQ